MAAAIGFQNKTFPFISSNYASWRAEVLYGFTNYIPSPSQALKRECTLKVLVFDTILLRAFSLPGLSGPGSGDVRKNKFVVGQAGQAGGLKSSDGLWNISRGGTDFESYITISISL